MGRHWRPDARESPARGASRARRLTSRKGQQKRPHQFIIPLIKPPSNGGRRTTLMANPLPGYLSFPTSFVF
jgi:hypothetical protein